METGHPFSPSRRLLLWGTAALLLLAGCQKNEEIEKYQVLRPQVVRPKKPLNRMLAAIFPRDDRSWFIKLVGPEAAIGKHEAAFDQFVHSIRIKDGDDPPLTWKVPRGWRRKPGGGGVRFATFLLGPEGRPLEVAVLSLGGSVFDNVNRWRKQLELPPVPQAELGTVARKTDIHGAVAYQVDMSGTGSGQTQMPPFAGHGHGGGGRVRGVSLRYDTPEGWKALAIPKTLPMAAFQIGQGDQAARAGIVPLPRRGGDLLRLVNGWRRELHLKPVGSGGLKGLRRLEVDGSPARYVDLQGSRKETGRERILGVVLERQGQLWVITLKGAADLVAEQKAAFEDFVQSVKFGRDKGANDE